MWVFSCLASTTTCNLNGITLEEKFLNKHHIVTASELTLLFNNRLKSLWPKVLSLEDNQHIDTEFDSEDEEHKKNKQMIMTFAYTVYYLAINVVTASTLTEEMIDMLPLFMHLSNVTR